MVRASLPSREGWPVVWVFSYFMALGQEQTRREKLAKAEVSLVALNASLSGARPRHRLRKDVEETKPRSWPTTGWCAT